MTIAPEILAIITTVAAVILAVVPTILPEVTAAVILAVAQVPAIVAAFALEILPIVTTFTAEVLTIVTTFLASGGAALLAIVVHGVTGIGKRRRFRTTLDLTLGLRLLTLLGAHLRPCFGTLGPGLLSPGLLLGTAFTLDAASIAIAALGKGRGYGRCRKQQGNQ